VSDPLDDAYARAVALAESLRAAIEKRDRPESVPAAPEPGMKNRWGRCAGCNGTGLIGVTDFCLCEIGREIQRRVQTGDPDPRGHALPERKLEQFQKPETIQ